MTDMGKTEYFADNMYSYRPDHDDGSDTENGGKYSYYGRDVLNKILTDSANYSSVSEGIIRMLNNKDLSNTADVEENINILTRIMKEKEIPNKENFVAKWLNKNSDPQTKKASYNKKNMIRLCFALELGHEKSAEFLNKVFFEYPFNYRNPEEAIYAFYLEKHLPYSQAEEHIRRINDYIQGRDDNDADNEQTLIIEETVMKCNNPEELDQYIKSNFSKFNNSPQTAKKEAKELLEHALEISADKNCEEKVSVGLLLREIYGMAMREQIDGKTINNSSLLRKKSAFLEYVRLNLPDETQISRLINGNELSADAIRKLIILLHFYVFFSDDELAENNYNNADMDYQDAINEILKNCGYGEMYARNPYDYIFLLCSTVSPDSLENGDLKNTSNSGRNSSFEELSDYMPANNPLEEFANIISDMMASAKNAK